LRRSSYLLGILGYVVAPITLIWAWIRWIGQPKLWSPAPCFSLAGLSLATVSAILAASSVVYAQIHGFGWYDPLLLKLMMWGLVLSFGGLVLSLGGVWQKNAVRWQTPVASVAMAAFWLLAAALE
jgi:hypothetical protein